MQPALIFFHSLIKWLLLAGLICSIYRAYRGWKLGLVFSKADNAVRHWTATIAHIQLVIGILLYTQSPVTSYFWKNFKENTHEPQALFFGMVHIALMLTAIVLLTIGSSLAKRRSTDKEKFKTMLAYFLIALFIIFIAIPWPFSPLAQRPYFRTF